jgi:hypothetical protein
VSARTSVVRFASAVVRSRLVQSLKITQEGRSPGGWGSPPEKKARSKVRARRARRTWRFSLRKESSFEGLSEANPGGLGEGGVPPGKKAHSKARTKRARRTWRGFSQKRRLIRRSEPGGLEGLPQKRRLIRRPERARECGMGRGPGGFSPEAHTKAHR